MGAFFMFRMALFLLLALIMPGLPQADEKPILPVAIEEELGGQFPRYELVEGVFFIELKSPSSYFSVRLSSEPASCQFVWHPAGGFGTVLASDCRGNYDPSISTTPAERGRGLTPDLVRQQVQQIAQRFWRANPISPALMVDTLLGDDPDMVEVLGTPEDSLLGRRGGFRHTAVSVQRGRMSNSYEIGRRGDECWFVMRDLGDNLRIMAIWDSILLRIYPKDDPNWPPRFAAFRDIGCDGQMDVVGFEGNSWTVTDLEPVQRAAQETLEKEFLPAFMGMWQARLLLIGR